MSERKDPPEFTPKTCPVCGGRAMNAFKDRENFTSFEMVCWDCGKHHFYKMADDKKSFIKVDKLELEQNSGCVTAAVLFL